MRIITCEGYDIPYERILLRPIVFDKAENRYVLNCQSIDNASIEGTVARFVKAEGAKVVAEKIRRSYVRGAKIYDVRSDTVFYEKDNYTE